MARPTLGARTDSARCSRSFPDIDRIEAAFRAACADELAALKPGNVHVHAAGHRMTLADFERSAAAAAGPLCAPGTRLGARILGAVAATRDAVGQNTNLGILLLCAPLAAAAEPGTDLRPTLAAVLDPGGMDDARDLFAAIALAAPGGLGDAPAHDVRAPAAVPLSVAMTAAADRDSIAREWATGFAGIFGFGLPTLAEAGPAPWAATRLHLAFMAAWPDSHVARKHGAAAALAVQAEAAAMLAAHPDLAAAAPALLAWDAALKARAINPGTSADLTVATLFAARLQGAPRGILRARSDGD